MNSDDVKATADPRDQFDLSGKRGPNYRCILGTGTSICLDF